MTGERTMMALVGEAYGVGGGIAQFNRDFFGALDRIGGWRVNVLPRHAPADPGVVPASVRQERSIPGRFLYALRAVRYALATRPQVVFCGHLYMAPLAALAARLVRARLMIQVHGLEGWTRPGAAVRHAVRQADLVVGVSRDTCERVLAWARDAEGSIALLHNTFGDGFIPGDREAARRRWDVRDGPVLLTVSRLDSRERYKGQDRVIERLPDLLPEHPGIVYLIAGEGDDQHRLEQMAQTLGVLKHVRFLGAVSPEDLPTLYRAADLFVMPSTGEGFGIVYLEAMGSGVPALGLAVGGAPDALGDGELGLCVAPENFPEALASALRSTPRAGPALAQAVRNRFGAEAFTGHVDRLMARLASAVDPA